MGAKEALIALENVCCYSQDAKKLGEKCLVELSNESPVESLLDSNMTGSNWYRKMY